MPHACCRYCKDSRNYFALSSWHTGNQRVRPCRPEHGHEQVLQSSRLVSWLCKFHPRLVRRGQRLSSRQRGRLWKHWESGTYGTLLTGGTQSTTYFRYHTQSAENPFRLCGARRRRWGADISPSRTRTALGTFSISSAITASVATCRAPRSTPPERRPVAVLAAARTVSALGSPTVLQSIFIWINDRTKGELKYACYC